MNQIYPDSIHADGLETGAQFLDFVMETLMKRGVVLQPYTSRKNQFSLGESLQGWEVKLDNRFTETGRLSIEIAEKSKASNAAWIPSGIYRRDNTWLYIQGNYEYLFIFMKKFLVSLHKSGRYKEDVIPTLKKFYLPLADAEKYGYKITP